MQEFMIRFTRYEVANGRTISGPVLIMADNFRLATDKADLILQGMRLAGDHYDYDLAIVQAMRLIGDQSESMCDIWNVREGEDD